MFNMKLELYNTRTKLRKYKEYVLAHEIYAWVIVAELVFFCQCQIHHIETELFYDKKI